MKFMNMFDYCFLRMILYIIEPYQKENFHRFGVCHQLALLQIPQHCYNPTIIEITFI